MKLLHDKHMNMKKKMQTMTIELISCGANMLRKEIMTDSMNILGQLNCMNL